MPLTCWDCGGDGHIATDCPNAEHLGDGRPMWCGTCDEHSRHWYDADGRAHRCQCHPLSHQLIKQHRRCPSSCKSLIYVWDQAPCDQHQEVGRQLAHLELAKQPIRRDEPGLQELAARQVAESRARHDWPGGPPPAAPQPAGTTPPPTSPR
jgi:hypothetical protein